MAQKGSSGSNLSALLLHQAEARTKLVVDCAGLLRRLEELDSQIAEYDHWQRYPTNRYKSNVQIRFEEARRREAEEARSRGADGRLPLASLGDLSLVPKAPQAPAPLQRNPRPQSAMATRSVVEEDDGEDSSAIKMLQRALRATEFEAEVWRHRAHEAALASDREREQARRLMEFEISVALQEADEERKRSALLLRDRDAAFEKIEAEFGALRQEHAKNVEALGVSRRREAEQQMQVKRLTVAMASEEAAFKAAKSDLELQRSHSANLKKELQDVRAQREQDVLEARSQRDNAIRTLEAQRSELCRATEATIAKLEAELVTAKRDVEGAAAEKEKQRTLATQLELQLGHLHTECESHRKQCESKAEALIGAQMRVEMLGAKCENLQVALDNATRRQAELAIERDTLKDRTNNLVGVQQRIDFEVDALRDSVEKIANIDTRLGQKQLGDKLMLDDSIQFGSSTASTAVGSRVSSPRESVASVSPQLPPVRPSSASRKSPNWRRDLLSPQGLPIS